ncbi:hypothetical protein AVEN_94442-1 [Araneus ventricosus]|uniref:Uncharacterized protein n=1 Tax=Araneus ventricosus TaxID=182803 RepID=A0A4Y2P3H7_ARAVE|nr:hypothetical protein AVEN_94442-1 [Araneus ventricosus]
MLKCYVDSAPETCLPLWSMRKLEYCFPIYCCASKSNLEKLEESPIKCCRYHYWTETQLSIIVLTEADFQPLHVKRQASLVKYYNKLSSIDQSNKTARYLNNWTHYQRLKKNSPFSQVKSQHIIVDNVEPHYLHCNLNTLEELSRVNFHYNLSTASNKKSCVLDFLKQLALEIINNISLNDFKIHNYGSKTVKQAGSGIYIETPRDKYS